MGRHLWGHRCRQQERGQAVWLIKAAYDAVKENESAYSARRMDNWPRRSNGKGAYFLRT